VTRVARYTHGPHTEPTTKPSKKTMNKTSQSSDAGITSS